jgi:Zn-dependent protease with chaperone function
LVGLFIFAVLGIVVLTNLLVLAVSNYSNSDRLVTGELTYSWSMFIGVSLLVITLVGLATLFRIISLGKGGAAVAELLSGELLADGAGDFHKRRLLNVVEEMAIASGTPVPPVYLIPDDAINAFAAGYTTGDAVIGVTRGAMVELNREQLQGVIAHEFSHILNGDMRLNIRLMGVLYGILVLAIVGRILLSSGRHSSRNSGAAILGLGIGLLVIGYVGQFFGNWIKAAVSRQREYLADASAVQFTRHPTGIANALKRIGGYEGGSRIEDPKGAEVSHAFFAEGVKLSFRTLMATHPPLNERIQRIEPGWQGEMLYESVEDPVESPVAGFAGMSGVSQIDADEIVAEIGNPAASRIDVARALIAAIPSSLCEAAREPYSARAIVYLLLLDDDVLVRERQLAHLKESADPFVFGRFTELLDQGHEVEADMRLPLLEMALPQLRQLSAPQYEKFKQNIDVLIRADARIQLSEWVLQKLIAKHLGSALEGKRTSVRHKSLATLADECGILLSMLSFADRTASVSPQVAFEAGQAELDLQLSLLPKASLKLSLLDAALDRLAGLHPLKKPRLIKACVATVTADAVVSTVEGELLRAIADCLDCPMPPIESITAAIGAPGS